MQLRYVFTELRSGLRRNLSMHIAVVLTLFVSLTLAGIGGMMKMQSDRVADYLGSQLEITAYMCTADDVNNPLCVGEVTDTQKAAIEKVIKENPEVASYRYESKEEGFEKVKEFYPDLETEGPNAVVTIDAVPQSYWITLKDPKEADGIISAVDGLDGFSHIEDGREGLEPVYTILDAMKYGSWGIAGFLILAALMLVANTIRLTAMARRKEIAIMRLVGASNLYITLPFLLEALVIAFLGGGLAAGAMAGFMKFGIIDTFSDRFEFLPWIGWGSYTDALVGFWPPGIVLLAPILTVVPTLLLTRKYIKV